MFCWFFFCPRQGHCMSQVTPDQTPVSLLMVQSQSSPEPLGCHHVVVCVNILHSQLWARGSWERAVYSFCHGKRQLMKEQSPHWADPTKCNLPSEPRRHPSRAVHQAPWVALLWPSVTRTRCDIRQTCVPGLQLLTCCEKLSAHLPLL